MLSPRITNCPDCANIECLINDIDCKINQTSKDLYNNTRFLLNKKIDTTEILSLLVYRRVLLYKSFNQEYVKEYSPNDIIGKIKRITAGCLVHCDDCNSFKSII